MTAITMGELCYSVTLAVLGGMLSFAAAAGRRDGQRLTLFFLGSFALRVGLVFLNASFDILPQKHASVFAWGLLNQKGGLGAIFGPKILGTDDLPKLKFLLEALLNAPALLLFENAPIMLNLTNCFVGAMAGIVVFAYCVRLFGRRAALLALLATSFFPAAVSFSLFGLRDIIVYFFLLAEIFSFSWLVLRTDHRSSNLLVFAGSFLCVVILRMAFLPFLLILPAWFALTAALRFIRGIKDRSRRMLLGSMAAMGLFLAGAGTLVLSYSVVLHSVKIDYLATPDVLFRQYAEERAWRGYDPVGYQRTWRSSHGAADYSPSDGTAAASEYLSAGTYLHLPWLERVLVQVVGFIVIPFPWQLNSLARALAMFDSVFLVVCLCGAWRAHRMLRPSAAGTLPMPASPAIALQTLSLALLLSFLLSWLGYALLVSDAGNAFRMRLSVVPFIILGASLYGVSAPWSGRLEGLLCGARESIRLPASTPSGCGPAAHHCGLQNSAH
jgi:hypothetical protein